MPLYFSDTFKQTNRNSRITKSSYFPLLDTFDINYAITSFQNQIQGSPSDDENVRYIIDNPYVMHADFGTVQANAGDLHVLNGITLGTGDIIQSTDFDTRYKDNIRYRLTLDASNLGPCPSSQSGFQGTFVFNDYDKKFYGYDGTTWTFLLKDYVEKIKPESGTLKVVYGDGTQNYIPLSSVSPATLEVGVSGGINPFPIYTLNFVAGNGVTIVGTQDGSTGSIEISSNVSGGGDVDSVSGVTGAISITGDNGVVVTVGEHPDKGITIDLGFQSIPTNRLISNTISFSGATGIGLIQAGPAPLGGAVVHYVKLDYDTINVNGSGEITVANPFAGITATDDNGSAVSVLSTDNRITINAGTGLDKSVDGSILTLSGENASYTNKGIALFDQNDFVVNEGGVSLDNTVVKGFTTGQYSGTQTTVTPSSHFVSILGGFGITCSSPSSDTIKIEAWPADTTSSRTWSFDSSAIASPSSITSGKTSVSVSTWPSSGANMYLYFSNTDRNGFSVVNYIKSLQVGDEVIYYDTQSPAGDFIRGTCTQYQIGSPVWSYDEENGIFTVYLSVIDFGGTSTSSDRNKDVFALEIVNRSNLIFSQETSLVYRNSQPLHSYQFASSNPSSNGAIYIESAIPLNVMQIHKFDLEGTDNTTLFSSFTDTDNNILRLVSQPGQKGVSGAYAEYTLGPAGYNGTYYSFDIKDTVTSGDDLTVGDKVFLEIEAGPILNYVQSFNGQTGAVEGVSTVNGQTGDVTISGTLGPTGPTGADGAKGEDGAQGPIGPTGAQGDQGIQGPTGADGAKGEDGAQGPIGPTGPTGAQGDQGIQGEIGPTGAQGDQGIQGPTGAQGDQGIQGPTGADGAKGEDGAQGPTGPTGAQGDQGIQGPTGADGAKGEDGAQGPIGPTGPTGGTGPQGDTGPGVGFTTGADTPSSANTGDFWLETDTGDLFFYDGSSFIQISGADGATGPTGPVGDYVETFNGATGAVEGVSSLNGATGDVKTQFPLVFNLNSTLSLATGQQLDFAQIMPYDAKLIQTDLYVPDGCANASTDVFVRLKKSTSANMNNSQANIDAAGVTLELSITPPLSGYNDQQILVEGTKSGAAYFTTLTNGHTLGNTAGVGEYVYVYLEENDPSATNIIVSTLWEVI